jgi:hypothetical protein
MTLKIDNVPRELMWYLREAAARKKESIRAYVLRLLSADQNGTKKKERK